MMVRRPLVCVVAGVVLALGAFTGGDAAAATILFEQPLDNRLGFGGWNSNGPAHIATSPFTSSQQIADDFVLADASILSAISWFGQYDDSAVPVAGKDFAVRLFADGLAAPGTKIYEHSVSVVGIDTGGATPSGDSILSYAVGLPVAQSVSAGTTYWLSILENDASTDSIWRWSFGGPDGPFGLRFSELGAWNLMPVAGRNLAFSLEGAVVPLPAALPLMAVALVVLTATTAGVGRGGRAPNRQRRRTAPN
jgi:hypothetical protein